MADPIHGALVLFSGGQDSSVCLAWALERYSHVETVGFDYGQRHAVELTAADTVRAKLIQRFPAWAGRIGELLKTGREKRALRFSKKKLGTHSRGKAKREEVADMLRKKK